MSVSTSSAGGTINNCCNPCDCPKTNSSSGQKVSKNSGCSCSQKYKVYWYFEQKDPNASFSCGQPGSSTIEYWARASMNAIGKPKCQPEGDCCDCQDCEDAKRDALNAARPDNTTVTSQVQWDGPYNCDRCPEPNSCYNANEGNTGPSLPEPEISVDWSCKCS